MLGNVHAVGAAGKAGGGACGGAGGGAKCAHESHSCVGIRSQGRPSMKYASLPLLSAWASPSELTASSSCASGVSGAARAARRARTMRRTSAATSVETWKSRRMEEDSRLTKAKAATHREREGRGRSDSVGRGSRARWQASARRAGGARTIESAQRRQKDGADYDLGDVLDLRRGRRAEGAGGGGGADHSDGADPSAAAGRSARAALPRPPAACRIAHWRRNASQRQRT